MNVGSTSVDRRTCLAGRFPGWMLNGLSAISKGTKRGAKADDCVTESFLILLDNFSLLRHSYGWKHVRKGTGCHERPPLQKTSPHRIPRQNVTSSSTSSGRWLRFKCEARRRMEHTPFSRWRCRRAGRNPRCTFMRRRRRFRFLRASSSLGPYATTIRMSLRGLCRHCSYSSQCAALLSQRREDCVQHAGGDCSGLDGGILPGTGNPTAGGVSAAREPDMKLVDAVGRKYGIELSGEGD